MTQTSPKSMKTTLMLFPLRPERNQNWLELPEELTALILVRLATVDMMTARKVCKTWRRICSEPAMWRVVVLAPCDYAYDIGLKSVARKAVDLSRGQLIEISISNLKTTDYYLQYISDRSSQLRRLRLSSCNGMTSEGLSEMFKKLPLLEELHLEYMPISKQAIEVAGRCCPLLKSFKLNNHGYRCPYIKHDEDALAIAENLHALRHLQLFNNKMTINGLLAITENCSYLESLDIRQCFNVTELGSDLRRRLSEHIKDLRLPDDSTEYRGFDTEMHNWEACRSSTRPFGLYNTEIFPEMIDDHGVMDFDLLASLDSDLSESFGNIDSGLQYFGS